MKKSHLLSIFVLPFLLGACSFVGPELSSGFGILPCHERPADNLAQPIAPRGAVALLPEPELSVTPEVVSELRLLLGRERYFLAASIERREKYESVMAQIFKDEGVPTTLLNVALIESGFNPEARSPAGAVGMWQFMRATGRVYGLKIDRRQDQRRDIVLSSIAAARHLKDLYNVFQDWHLAMAAYNAGQGGINRAMQKAGVDDYWSLVRRRKIRLQTARYVPRIIAASIIMKNLAKYDLSTLAGNFDWLQEEKNGSVQVANWSGARRSSAS